MSVERPAQAAARILLHCPACGLTLRPRTDWLAVEHCPRCVARRSARVRMELARAEPDRSMTADGQGLVERWLDAVNARNLGALLACADTDIEFHPARVRGVQRVYRGHDGIRRWLMTLDEAGHGHRLTIAEVRTAGDGRVFALGAVDLPAQPEAAPFWGLYRLADGRIRVARHSLTDGDLAGDLGWLE